MGSARRRFAPLRPRQRRRGAAALILTAGIALLAGCGSSDASKRGAANAHGASAAHSSAPACLPATVGRSAALAGVPVDVSPAPGSATADPRTQISFLGLTPSQIRKLSVVGARSGTHAGRLEAYSQGDGASFVPDAPFQPGERVLVRALLGASATAGKRIAFDFHVDTPWSTAGVKGFANPAVPSADYQSFVTAPGIQAPTLTVTTPDRDPSAGDILVTNGPGPGRYGALIYTPQGRLVWFDQLAGGAVADNLSVQTYNGRQDLTFWQGKVLALGFGQGEDVVMDSHYRVLATVRGGNGLAADLHDFQIAAGNVAYITAYNPIRCDLASKQGPSDGVILDAAVEEIDMRTGLVRWEWHALDNVGVSESQYSPSPTNAWDFFHVNSIDPQPDGGILISARNTWAEYLLQARSGRILWQLGGQGSTFTMGPGTATYWQHDGRILPGGEITLFDDGSDPPHEPQSRAVTIALDFKGHQARLVTARTHPAVPLLAASQGNVQTLAGGNSVVGFGGVPYISEYATDGSLLFDAHLPVEEVFYRAFRFPWSGQPLTAPAVVASLNNVSETIVRMSWNGATAVGAWRVLAGNARGSLAAQATIPASGFETSTVLPQSFAYAAVQALDAAGHVLGTSHAVRVATYAAAFP